MDNLLKVFHQIEIEYTRANFILQTLGERFNVYVDYTPKDRIRYPKAQTQKSRKLQQNSHGTEPKGFGSKK